jgi:hypothetical protein
MSANNPFNEELPAELKAVERVLRRLQPSADRLDRDRLMYLSGRASVPSQRNTRRWMWPISTAALLLVSLTLGGMLLNSARGWRQTEPLANRPLGQNTVATESQNGAGRSVDLAIADREPSSYLQLRNTVLLGGVDALPAPQGKVRASNPMESIPSMSLKLNYFGG